MRARSALLLGMFAAACKGGEGNDSNHAHLWCEALDDANTYSIEDGGGNASSGRIEGRIITSGSEDLHDPNYIADLDFTLQSVTSGGQPQTGATDDYGEFVRQVGEGTWLLEAAKVFSTGTCVAEYEFEVITDKTTRVCAELACE